MRGLLLSTTVLISRSIKSTFTVLGEGIKSKKVKKACVVTCHLMASQPSLLTRGLIRTVEMRLSLSFSLNSSFLTAHV